MPEYAPGTPSWIDLSSPDPDASAAFYGTVMGWTTTEPVAEAGGYRRFSRVMPRSPAPTSSTSRTRSAGSRS